ncbi:selenocysteine-specific translation elongation factor [Angustibacter sp. McL0619]|uniref:selenocysteine-specific translation elongation factor n=1 Tax=Angustibacter sp. McL0619 TaxID=3415676 RepID=UPI003CF9B97D
MHVLATAGHVDHGKSSLVRALTGQEPDRYAEEQRRGLTIDLGFVWTTLDDQTIAFVDVPGHERFVPTMLAGLGPVPAVVLVVAADGGWMPQTQEHLDAIEALGVRHGVVVVSRSDLADPGPVGQDVRDRLRHTGLASAELVSASARTGAGLDSVRAAILRLVRSLPQPAKDAPVRLWVDRSFTIRGAGTVVTGTLSAGTIRQGDLLELDDGTTATVRGLQSLEQQHAQVPAVARVAVNLRGVARERVSRGDALVSPDAFWRTEIVDVRCSATPDRAPSTAVLHVGSAQVTVHVRPLGEDLWRLRLERPLRLHLGDAGLLRDPGQRRVLTGVRVLDVDPPSLRRRGAAKVRAIELARATGDADVEQEVQRRGVVSGAHLLAMGVPAAALEAHGAVGEWLVHDGLAERLSGRLSELVAQHDAQHPLDRGLPLESARAELSLPSVQVVPQLVRPPLTITRGRVLRGGDDPQHLPDDVASAVRQLVTELDLASEPVPAASGQRLTELGLGRREVAAAVRTGHLVDCGGGVLLTPDAVDRAVRLLAALDPPFAVAAARDVWQTSRRVAVPLLELLDQRSLTVRDDEGLRVLAQTPASGGRLGT